ncbi:ATP-binding cassette domain-containing protein [Candidatus Omnitrophota bacterium]
MIKITDLYKHFSAKKSFFGKGGSIIRAVDGVSLAIPRSGTLGLVGESASGKTTLGKLLLGLLLPDSGDIIIDGKSIYKNGKVRRKVLSDCQYIFQDPFSSLDPRMKVGDIICEGLDIRGSPAAERSANLKKVLDLVRLPEASRGKYPHEFSGGQRQRIAIARAVSTNPKFIVCDEPVSSLDVSIQARILNLLKDLQEQLGLTYLFISHDLAVVEYMADEVAVMLQGKIVEQGPRNEIFSSPGHPYTKRLIDSILKLPA